MRRLERPARRELLIVLACTLVGAGLRFWSFGRLGLTHFDEGVYALAGLWAVAPGGLSSFDPLEIPYAPPGFALLIGLGYVAFGVGDSVALLVSALCGVLTIPVSAWLGRRTFGPGGGAATAALASLSMAHIGFSRKALTDVPFLLAWLVAMGLGGRFLERPGAMRGIALGFAVGLAQNLKYNGWIAGVVVALAAGVAAFLPAGAGTAGDARWRRAAALIGFLALAAAVALLTYGPWLQFVEHHGGYASLIRHHRSYVGGIRTWPYYWSRQLGQVVALSGGARWTAVSWLVAVAASAWVGNVPLRVQGPGRTRPAWWLFALPAGALVVAMLPSAPWWIGLVLVPSLLRDGRPGARILAVWWLILSLMTPMYHPYARLWLPLHAAGWLLLSGSIVRILTAPGLEREVPASPEDSRSGPHPGRLVLRRSILGAVVLAAMGQRLVSSPRAFASAEFFRETSTLRDLVQELPRILPDEPGRSRLRVLGRRPLAFYLLVQGRFPFQLLAGPEDVKIPVVPPAWTIVDGVLLDRATQSELARQGAGRAFVEILDPVTLLDVAPDAAFGDLSGRRAELWVIHGAIGAEPGRAPGLQSR